MEIRGNIGSLKLRWRDAIQKYTNELREHSDKHKNEGLAGWKLYAATENRKMANELDYSEQSEPSRINLMCVVLIPDCINLHTNLMWWETYTNFVNEVTRQPWTHDNIYWHATKIIVIGLTLHDVLCWCLVCNYIVMLRDDSWLRIAIALAGRRRRWIFIVVLPVGNTERACEDDVWM